MIRFPNNYPDSLMVLHGVGGEHSCLEFLVVFSRGNFTTPSGLQYTPLDPSNAVDMLGVDWGRRE